MRSVSRKHIMKLPSTPLYWHNAYTSYIYIYILHTYLLHTYYRRIDCICIKQTRIDNIYTYCRRIDCKCIIQTCIDNIYTYILPVYMYLDALQAGLKKKSLLHIYYRGTYCTDIHSKTLYSFCIAWIYVFIYITSIFIANILYITYILQFSEWGGDQQLRRWVAPPGGTEVDMMGMDRILQSMTRVGASAGSRRELPALLYLYNGLYSR